MKKLKRKYKIVQECINGELCYRGYRYILGVIPVHIPGVTAYSRDTCMEYIRNYDYCLKPWYEIFWL